MRFNPILVYFKLPLVTLFLVVSCSELSNVTPKERHELGLLYVQRGLKSKSDGNQDKAVRFFEKAIEADSTLANAYIEIGECLILKKAYRKAEIFLIHMPSFIESDARVYYLIGSAQFYQDQINESVESLEKAIAMDPDLKGAYRMLAKLYDRLENYEQASRYLEHLLHDTVSPNYEKDNALYQKISVILNNRNPKALFEKNKYEEISRSNVVTRGQLAFVIATELQNLNDKKQSDIHFTDIVNDDPMIDYYKKVVIQGILERLPDGKFYPGYMVKRRDLAYYLYRILGEQKLNGAQTNGGSVLNDVTKGDFEYNEIQTVCRLNVMSLYENGNFGPDKPLSGMELINSMAALKRIINGR